MNRIFMQILHGTAVAVSFLVGYTLFNTLALILFPQFIYYFAVVHVLLIPYVTLFYTLTTYYKSHNKTLTRNMFIYSLVGSSMLIGIYLFFPTPSYYIKIVMLFVLPFIAAYNYFSYDN